MKLIKCEIGEVTSYNTFFLVQFPKGSIMFNSTHGTLILQDEFILKIIRKGKYSYADHDQRAVFEDIRDSNIYYRLPVAFILEQDKSAMRELLKKKILASGEIDRFTRYYDVALREWIGYDDKKW